MNIPRNWLFAAAVAVAVPTASVARAAFIPISQPDAAYVSGTNLIALTAADFDAVASISDGTQTVGFENGMFPIDLVQLTVPDTWTSWGAPPDTESATPRVLWTNGFTSVSLTFLDSTTFGFELEPTTQFVSTMTAEFFDGAVSLG